MAYRRAMDMSKLVAVFSYGGKGVIKIIPGNEKNAAILLEALKERIPDLDMTVPEIYKNRTRDPM